MAVLGDGGVGKTALAVQVCWFSRLTVSCQSSFDSHSLL